MTYSSLRDHLNHSGSSNTFVTSQSIETIAGALAPSRNTIQPPLDELVERRWAERDGETYRITPLGAFITMEYLEFLDTFKEIAESEDSIQELPIEALSSIH